MILASLPVLLGAVEGGGGLFTAAELAEIDAYHRPRLLFLLFDSVTTPVLFALLVRFLTRPLWKAALWIEARLEPARGLPVLRVLSLVLDTVWRGPQALASLLFMTLWVQLMTLWGLPEVVYFGFIRERQFGMSSQSFGRFTFDWMKSHSLSTLAVAALAIGLFGLARRLRHWWLILAVVCAVGLQVATAIDPYRAQVYVAQTPLAAGELRSALESVLHQAQVEFGDIVIETTSGKSVRLNAYFAGAGATRTVVLNDTLLSHLTTSEIVAVVAHEAAHAKESRWLKQLGAALALGAFLAFFEWLFRRSAARGWFGIAARGDVRVFPLACLVFYLCQSVAMPVALAHSRGQELAADAFALSLTHDTASFESMLVKAARVNKMNPTPPRWYVWLFMSHPPIVERLAALRENP